MSKRRGLGNLPDIFRFQMSIGHVGADGRVVWHPCEPFARSAPASSSCRKSRQPALVRHLATGYIVQVNRAAYALGFRVHEPASIT